MRKFISKNPYTGQLVKEFEFLTDTQLNEKIKTGHNAFKTQTRFTFKQRSDQLLYLANKIEQKQDYLAEVITSEVGKPFIQALGEVKKSADHCKYYAENLKKFLKPKFINADAKNKSGITYEPTGLIYYIIPFNFPFWITFKGALPTIAAGNTVICRIADSTPQVGLEIEKLFLEADYMEGIYQNVFTTQEQLENICQHKEIRGVQFTGSSRAGSNIASIASKYLKKNLMELGGSDPFIVLKDADLDLAATIATTSRLNNCGQVCISAKRFLIDELVYDQFKEKLIEKVKNIKMGNPMHDDTNLGPMAREDLRENLRNQVQKAEKEGAKLIYQRTDSHPTGFFQNPSIYEIDQSNLMFREEIFGPVFPLVTFKNEQQMIDMANDTEYGLGGTIISKDRKRAEKLSQEIDTGSIFINELCKTDSRLPAGGTKNSGYGRDCSHEGIKEFVNIKTFYIN